MVDQTIPKVRLITNDTDPENRRILHLDIVRSISDNISATVSVTPIVTYDANNSFAFDTQANETFTIPFERTSPSVPVDASTDDTKWSNAKWILELKDFIDRWQARTDGCTFQYDTDDTTSVQMEEYFKPIYENVYIKTLSYQFRAGYVDYISGTLTLQVGSMYCKAADTAVRTDTYYYGKSVASTEQNIMMTSSTGMNYYMLYYTAHSNLNGDLPDALVDDAFEYSCVKSYTIKCGPLNPFPMISMTVSRKRLVNTAPELIDDIVPGRNVITVNAAGSERFIVTKCATSGDDYKITGYAIEEAYCGMSPLSDIYVNTSMTPIQIIRNQLLATYQIGSFQYLKFTSDRIRYRYRTANNVWTGDNTVQLDDSHTLPEYKNFTFSQRSLKVWQILQICALRMNCIVFFMEGNVYIIDTTIGSDETEGITSNMSDSDIHHFSRMYLNTIPFITLTSEQKDLCGAVTGHPSIGNEGTDALYNSSYVINRVSKESTEMQKAAEDNGIYATSRTDLDPDNTDILSRSYVKFTEHALSKMDLNILPYNDTDTIANNYPKRFCDTQQSISFTVAERFDNKWQARFPNICTAERIIDFNSDLVLYDISSFDDGSGTRFKMPQKLTLAKIERNFPEFTSTYTFGAMAATDMAQTTSQILNTIS